jgi:hypothetical protein
MAKMSERKPKKLLTNSSREKTKPDSLNTTSSENSSTLSMMSKKVKICKPSWIGKMTRLHPRKRRKRRRTRRSQRRYSFKRERIHSYLVTVLLNSLDNLAGAMVDQAMRKLSSITHTGLRKRSLEVLQEAYSLVDQSTMSLVIHNPN